MGTFGESVAALQPAMSALMTEPDVQTFIAASDRLTEAAAADGCVSRAVYGELDPSGELAISRNRTVRPWLPGLGWYLQGKGKMEGCGDRELQAMAESVRRTLACGWLFTCTPQVHAVARGEREIWTQWAPSAEGADLSEMLGEKKLADRIKREGGVIFREGLRATDVVGRRGRLTVEMIGAHLATLGVYLRMLQTSEIRDDAFAVTPPQTREDPGDLGRWAWDRYPVDQLALL